MVKAKQSGGRPREQRVDTSIAAVLDRAIGRGELASRPDPALVQALLLGPLYAWLIVLDEDPARVPELVRVVATTALATGVVPA
ncbi:TetR/AcrR family transcriptional regulator C-terminal ligand-binding domain-containing protein [Nocardia sp. NPDC050717]|uniref:TetR/AcrR family transcriptional regulator C-terminal ligand-binding domain-containing protein n=1 Tax=Nocardia sp. NPDC050717 TaxID=3157221 RepID=UPI0033ECD560